MGEVWLRLGIDSTENGIIGFVAVALSILFSVSTMEEWEDPM